MSRYVCLCGYLCIFIFNFVDSEIRFAFELFRHGARSPYGGYDKDYLDSYKQKWDGKGELSGIGMRQQYLLGVRNRKRFEKLLSATYDPREIYVVSSDKNRTLMSAYAQLQGLYPPGTNSDLTPKQAEIAVPPVNKTAYEEEMAKLGLNVLPHQMQVLPIHIFDPKDHTFQLQDENICPGVFPYIKEFQNSQPVKNFMETFSNTYGAKLMKIMNRPNMTFLTDYWELHSVLDTFIADYTDQRDLSILTNEGISLDKFLAEAQRFMQIDFIGPYENYESKIAILAMSPTVLKIVKWMQARVDHDIKGEKILSYQEPLFAMYSAHDTNIAGIQMFMKSIFGTEAEYGPYAANVFLELHRPDKFEKLSEREFTVVYIVNDKIKLEVPFPEFREKVKYKAWNREIIEDFCQFVNDDKPCAINYFMIATIILALISVALAIFVVHICLNKRSDSSTNQSAYTRV